MKKIVFGVFLIISFMPSAYAVKMNAIYQAEVLVASQAEKTREQGVQQAFAQVLTKVSGNPRILQNPSIQVALSQAKNNIQEFEYLPSGDRAAPFLLKVQFDPTAVKELLQKAQVPLWDENRPLILVWLAIADQKQRTELIADSSTNHFVDLLKKRAYQRGIPLLLPSLDMTDLNQVSVTDVVQMARLPLAKASQRYHVDGLLLGHLRYQNKLIKSDWQLILGQDQWQWQLESGLAAVMVEEVIDKMSNILSARYTAVSSDKALSAFTMVVTEVAQQEDLQKLMHFMKRLSLITALDIDSIQGNEVVMHLSVQGSRQLFIQEAAVEQHLHLESETDAQLTYRWVP